MMVLSIILSLAALVLLRISPGQGPGNAHYSKALSVLIAARNEAESITKTLDDIGNQSVEEVIVVNDHSTDGTAQIAATKGARVLGLTESKGKKAAILRGVAEAQTDYVIQFDADVLVSQDYVESLRKHMDESLDLLVLPVKVKETNSWIQEIQRHEQAALALVNTAFNPPILINGANMVYKRKAFNELNAYGSNFSKASGDDHFLLHAMIRGAKEVKTIVDRDLIVEVQAAPTLKEFLEQRIRWAGKLISAPSLNYALLTILSGFVLFIPTLLILALAKSGGLLIGALSVVACMIWYLAQYVIVRRMHHFNGQSAPFIPVVLASIFFPYYAALVLILSIFVRPLWKGRRI